jgi:hypothetical protein
MAPHSPCARRTVNRYFYDAGSELTGVQMLESFGTDALAADTAVCRALRATYDEFERAMDRDRFMIAEEALEWGLVDRILQVGDDSIDHVGAT